MTSQITPQLEDILDAFAMEATHAKVTLDRYLTAYPQFAADFGDRPNSLQIWCD